MFDLERILDVEALAVAVEAFGRYARKDATRPMVDIISGVRSAELANLLELDDSQISSIESCAG